MKIKTILIVFSFLVFSTTFGQFHDYSVKYGIQGHFLIHDTDFDNDPYRFSHQTRGFLRFELTSGVETELGVGLAKLTAFDFFKSQWETVLIPADLRIVFAPFNFEKVNPYVYGGFGSLRWNVKIKPKSISPKATQESGWTQFIPFGAGVELAVSDNFLLGFSGGYNHTFSDDINYYNNGNANDGYFDFGASFIFVTGSGNTDADNDGLTEKQEKEIGTNPKIADTDGDGINDGDELNKYNTNPLAKDSDKDGLNDYEEIFTYKTDANSSDTDGDELSDYAEIITYKSNPNKKDTDGDSLGDGYEVNKYKTNPIKKDTDGDGLDDNIELNKFKSNPLLKDTDNGGTDDFTEFKRKTDPNKPEDDVAIKKTEILDINAPMILEGVTFETGKAILTPESENILTKALNTLKAYPHLKVEIRGYTDNVGSAAFNLKLSQKRADAVKQWLVKKGIDATRLSAKGYGEANPIASNRTKEGRRKNRRIEFSKIK